MRMRKILYSLMAGVGLYTAVSLSMPLWSYKQDPREAVVITELGKPTRVDTTHGLGLKIPILESANKFTTRLVDYRSIPQDALTADKKTVQIDFYAMFKIVVPKLFLQTARTLDEAQRIIDDLVYSEMRNMVSKEYKLSNVLEKGEDIQTRVKDIVAPKLMDSIGIELYDIRLTTTNPTQDVLQAVYSRMKAERAQKAQSDRSEGERQKIQIEADADKEVVRLKSEAYSEAQTIKGGADATALKTIQDAYSKDPELAFFLRELSLLEETTREGDRLIISTDSELYDLMKGRE